MAERTRRMREYWDERARLNAAWYVDTSLSYDHPDMAAFLATGEKVVAEALDTAPVQPPGTGLAIEIGCGIGRICKALRARFDRVVGLDISSEMVQQARELVPDDGIAFEVCDGASLRPVEDGTADLVLTFTVFQHIPDPDVIAAYVSDAARVLRTGGLFVAQWNGTDAPTRWALRRRWLQVAARLGRRGDPHGRDQPEFLGTRVPVPQMRALLEGAGFDVKHVNGGGTLYSWFWAVRR